MSLNSILVVQYLISTPDLSSAEFMMTDLNTYVSHFFLGNCPNTFEPLEVVVLFFNVWNCHLFLILLELKLKVFNDVLIGSF